ncbi:MAG: 4Fe-4S dicluster domain-containing protein [Promethearchaeota archaeon]
MEGYGFPKRDPEKCVGCYACMSVCPDEVILVDDIKDKRVYSALHWDCMNCRKCEEVCPHEALKIVPGFEFKSYLENTPLSDIDRPLTQCKDCGVYFAAEPHITDLTNKVSTGKLPRADVPKELMAVCPTCRRKRVAQEMQVISVTTPL